MAYQAEETFSTITSFCACDNNDKGIAYITFIKNEGNEDALKDIEKFCNANIGVYGVTERHLFKFQQIPRKTVLEMMKYPFCDCEHVMIDEEVLSFFEKFYQRF